MLWGAGSVCPDLHGTRQAAVVPPQEVVGPRAHGHRGQRRAVDTGTGSGAHQAEEGRQNR